MLPVIAGVGVLALIGACVGLASKLIDARKAGREAYKEGYDQGQKEHKEKEE